jgi:hypothetical protein
MINWVTARPAGFVMRWMLSTPQDRAPAPILARADDLAGIWATRMKGPATV